MSALVDMVKEANVFKRNRTPLEVKVLAGMLCFAGLSYRKVEDSMPGRRDVEDGGAAGIHGHEGIAKPERKARRLIAVDETKAEVKGGQVYVWAARDVDTEEVLAFRVGFTRSSPNAELFLREVLKYCKEAFFPSG